MGREGLGRNRDVTSQFGPWDTSTHWAPLSSHFHKTTLQDPGFDPGPERVISGTPEGISTSLQVSLKCHVHIQVLGLTVTP